jgi:hypothetical protein
VNTGQAPRLENTGGGLSSNSVSVLPLPGSSAGSNNQQQNIDTGVRQQQYIIVQTTGSNGLPTNLAVPASFVLSQHGQLVLSDQNSKGPPRASSAPPVQSGQIMISQHQSMSYGNSLPNTVIGNHSNPNPTINVGSSQSSSNQMNSMLSTSKTMSIPTLEIQEGGGMRVSVYRPKRVRVCVYCFLNCKR